MTLAEKLFLFSKVTFIRQLHGIRINLCLCDERMNANTKLVSPLSHLTQADWDPLLTSWLEDSAVGPPHCHSYGAVSYVNEKW